MHKQTENKTYAQSLKPNLTENPNTILLLRYKRKFF